jgi:hypothetical protein
VGVELALFIAITCCISHLDRIALLVPLLCSVPGRITGAYCDGGGGQNRTGFEDYVTPGFPMTYRVHTIFLDIKDDITLKVR